MKRIYALCTLLLFVSAGTLSAQQIPLIRDLAIDLNIAKVKALGYKHIDSIKGLYGDQLTVSNIARNIPNVNASFYNFLYDDIFLIQTNKDANLSTLNANPKQNWELYYAIRAIQILQTKYPVAYQNLITASIKPNTSGIDIATYNEYINKFSKVVISFNAYSNSIAISGTQLGVMAGRETIGGTLFTIYNNLPVISINSDLILGANRNAGSYPIYQRGTADENFQLYMKEGLLHTIVHELIHRCTDVRNNNRASIYNYIGLGPGRTPIKHTYQYPLYDIEEVMVSKTINKYFRKVGGMSEELLRYYDMTEDQLLLRVGNFYYTYFLNEMRPKSDFNVSDMTYKLLD